MITECHSVACNTTLWAESKSVFRLSHVTLDIGNLALEKPPSLKEPANSVHTTNIITSDRLFFLNSRRIDSVSLRRPDATFLLPSYLRPVPATSQTYIDKWGGAEGIPSSVRAVLLTISIGPSAPANSYHIPIPGSTIPTSLHQNGAGYNLWVHSA
jgi:hypothetical protein